MNVVTETIPDGDEGTAIVLERMRELVAARIAHPVVRGVAVDLARRLPAHHLRAQAAAIRQYVARRVQFVSDPDGPELLHDPVLLLEQIDRHGVAMGDCDDVALLAAALGGAIGLPARFVVVSFAGPAAPFEHVWTELFDGEAWRELDVTRPYQRTAEAPAIQRRTIVDVLTGEATMSGAPNGDRWVTIPNPYPTRRRGRLGAIPGSREDNIGAFTAQVEHWTNVLKQLTGIFGGSKDTERNQLTDAAAREALNGNLIALLFLKQRTGDYGVVDIPGIGQVGGWGSPKAKAYAKQKYAATLAALPPTTIPGEDTQPIPIPGGGAPVMAGPLGDSSKVALAVIGLGLAFAVLKPKRSR